MGGSNVSGARWACEVGQCIRLAGAVEWGLGVVLRCGGWDRGSALSAAHLVRVLGRLKNTRCEAWVVRGMMSRALL